MPLSSLLSPCGFDDLSGWREDVLADAFRAFRRSATRPNAKPYRTGSLGLDAAAFDTANEAARLLDDALDEIAARRFFEDNFTPFRVTPDDRPTGFVTGFYEPVAEASRVPTDEFHVPIYARPADLVDVDDNNRPTELDPYHAFGRDTDAGIVEYHDRGEIERGALRGKSVEIAWLRDRVEAFFIHVQGAARLRFADGGETRITYAAKSGHRFTGPGHVLVGLGEIPYEKVSMQSIKAWFRANPDRIDEILWRNRSFIFFRDAPVDDSALGPVAAAKVPLTPGRSIAVDRLLHTFGTPVFVDAPDLHAFGPGGFRRLMIAQDTGSAIVGPARGDLFAGSGDAAGEIAGVVRADADFYVLVPRSLVVL